VSHFDLWWNGQEDSRTVVEQLVTGTIVELRWKTQLRVEATFAGPGLAAGQTPAWRIEAGRKVPWFAPKELCKAAFAAETPIEEPRKRNQRDLTEKAKAATEGRCMYCGSNHKLQARLVWPKELGGQVLQSNLGAACPVCTDFFGRLGPEMWGEALTAKSELAADVWWTAQKEANTAQTNFLK